MVQTGNEINYGILWPGGNIAHSDTLAAFFNIYDGIVKKYDIQ